MKNVIKQKYFLDYEAADSKVQARMHYYSFKQGIKYYRELERIVDA